MSRIQASLALAFVVACIAWAGLFPFEFARENRACWLDPGPGMRFEAGGVAWSTDPVDRIADHVSGALAVEVWLRVAQAPPGEERGFLALVDAPGTMAFGMRQEGTDLVVRDRVTNRRGEPWFNDFRLPGVLRPGAAQHVAVSSGGAGPSFHVDGRRVPARAEAPIPFARPGERFAGRLLVGATAPWREPWSGEVFALALRDRELDAESARRHAGARTADAMAAALAESGVVAAYAFDERAGATVRDRAGGGHGLEIPPCFRPPDLTVLAPPGADDWTRRWFATDAALNLVGFAPLGFLIVLLLGRGARRRSRAAVLRAAGLGGVASLAIELSQVAMATRSSSLVDLLMNTLGALAGALLAVHWLRRG